MEWFRLAALGRAVARGSSDILTPGVSTAGSIADNIANLPDLLQRPTGATSEHVLAICERMAEVQARCSTISGRRQTLGRRRDRQGASGVVGIGIAAGNVRCRLFPAEHAARRMSDRVYLSRADRSPSFPLSRA